MEVLSLLFISITSSAGRSYTVADVPVLILLRFGPAVRTSLYNKGIFVVAGVPRQWMAMVLVVQHHCRIRDPLNLLVTVSSHSSLVLGLQRFTVQLQGIEVSWLWPRATGDAKVANMYT